MSTPHQPDDDSHIADTGMFRRFVENEEQIDGAHAGTGSKGRWVAIGAIIAIVVIAVVVWALTR